MFCALRLIFGGIEDVGSGFHFLHSRIIFRRYRGRRVQFSWIAFPDPFSTVLRASGTVFMFCSPGLNFGGTKGARSSFALPDSFSTVPRAQGQVFRFCAPGLIFDDTEGAGSNFHVLRSGLIFDDTEGVKSSFLFRAPGLIFSGTEGVEFRFNVLRFRTSIRSYRGRRVHFLFFALLDPFSAI
jgi:hypothetical protein